MGWGGRIRESAEREKEGGKLPQLVLPDSFNYIACFLTFSCQLRCTYCINHHGGNLVKDRRMPGEDWIKGINRLVIPHPDLPVTLQGGEPTTHKDFYKIVNGIRADIPIDVLTNFEVDVERWIGEISPERLRRPSKYASIRVSYHHGQSRQEELFPRVYRALQKGFHIGIWEVGHPDYYSDVLKRQKIAQDMGIDYRVKEFLGPWKGVNHGTFRYDKAVNAAELRNCLCKTSELLIDPKGSIFRCHSDLYADRGSIGNIMGSESCTLGAWRFCEVMGKCNSCDVKLKTNRHQEHGHSSVEIKDISTPYAKNDEYVKEVVNTYGKR